ncbi:MAG: methyltransferase domain-containing protein [Alphaproteobacteria bacterium]
MDAADRARRTLYEAAKWSSYFEEALQDRGQEHDKSLWWRVSDLDSLAIARACLRNLAAPAICEPACGSGGTSILLAEMVGARDLTLVDISPSALSFARSLLPESLAGVTHLLEGDAFRLPLEDDRFDLTWNVGVIEHYPQSQILDLVREMRRVTRPGGAVLVAIPNRRSIATLKAALLGSHFGRRWLPRASGYRFDTEILYSANALAHLFEHTFGRPVAVRFAGNPLWVTAPEPLVRATQRLWPRSPFSFLAFLIFFK